MQISSNSSQLFWKKKTIISYFLSIMVFLIHISSFEQYPNTGSTSSLINESLSFLFTESITRFAVPMFFILSGIAFYRDYSNSKYLSKLKSRIFTLLIPYLVWNTIGMIFEIVCSYSFISEYYVGRAKFELTFSNILAGIFLYKCTPFWFIFDLMVFIIASPIINKVVQNKYIGLGSVLILSVLLTFNISLPASVIPNPDSIIYYLVGAIIGKHYFSYLQKRSTVRMQIISALFLLIIVILKNIFPNCSYTIKPTVITIVHIFSSVSVWFLFDAFIDRMKDRPLYSRSFYVYAMHINVSAIITKLTLFVLPRNEAYAVVNFIITIVLTLVSINVFCIVIEKRFPTINFILSGSRRQAARRRIDC